MTTDKLIITAKNALAAFTDAVVFASDDAMRPVLHAVQVTANAGRCQLVGCDSYVLGTFTFAGEGTLEALIDVDDAKRIIALAKSELKTYRAGATELVFERTDETLEVRGRDASLSMRLVIGEYPRWRSLFAEAELDGRGVLTAHVLGKLAKVWCGFKPAKNATRPGMRIEMHGLKPTHVELEHDGIVFVGLAMPSRFTSLVVEIDDPEIVETPSMVEARLALEARLAELAAEDDETTYFPNGTIDHEGTVAS